MSNDIFQYVAEFRHTEKKGLIRFIRIKGLGLALHSSQGYLMDVDVSSNKDVRYRFSSFVQQNTYVARNQVKRITFECDIIKDKTLESGDR